MHLLARGPLCLLVLLVATVVAGRPEAEAREGFYLGAGFASVSASGDLDGNTGPLVETSGTQAIVLGKPGSGSGYDLEIGYGFGKHTGVEYLFVRSHHTVTSSKIFPPLDTTADIDMGLLAIRLTAPVSHGFEVFARLGLARSTIRYADYAFNGYVSGNNFIYNSTESYSITGSGSGYGAGAEFLGEHWGVELAYTVFEISFDQVTTSQSSGSLSSSQKEKFGVATASFVYHL